MIIIPTAEVIIYERVTKYGLVEACVLPEKEFSDMSLEELRKYVTFFCKVPYCHSGNYFDLSNLLSYQKSIEIKEKLNTEFDKRVGEDFVMIYNHLDKIENKEKWAGEIRYQLLSYEHKPSQEFSQFRKTAKLLALSKNMNISASQMLEIMEVLEQSFWVNDSKNELSNSLVDSILTIEKEQ